MNDRCKPAERNRRRQRLSAALRENLKRRKAQVRARRDAAGTERARPSHDSAGIGDDKREG
jgi:hypothetical protein